MAGTKTRMVHPLTAIGVYAMLFALAGYATAADEPTSPQDLPALCRTAKGEFRPVTQSDAQKAKKVLVEALSRLDKRLTLAGENGQEWRKYLQWGDFQKCVQDEKQPNKDVLVQVYQRYAAGHPGLELVWFLDVQQATQNYIAMLNAVDNPQVKTAYEERMDKLAASLDAYVSKPTTEDALVISESVRWLENAGQAPAVVEIITQRFVQPNFLGEVSPALISAGIAESVDETISIRDCILGTDIHGTAHTVGQTSVELPPDPNFGVLDTIFFGTTTSNNVGYHHPVTIFSSSTTSLAARKRLWVSAEGLFSYPGVSNASTKINICDIQSNKGRRMVENVAWKRAGKQQGQAECIASSHAEARLNERIDQQAAEAVGTANKQYTEKFYKPFTERKLFPQVLRFATTEKGIGITGLQAGGGKVGAPSSPPAVAEGADMSLRLHESAVNNLAFDALAGRTVYEEELQAAVTDALGHLPEKMKGDDDGKPWAITFANRQPISVTFADDGYKITIRGVKYYKGQDAHPGMDVSASYKIEQTATGFKAVRQGDIQVFPPDFVPGKQVDARRQVIRKLLEKRFAKVFEPEIVGEGLELPGKLKSAGKLQPIQLVCRDGWLVIAWKRPAAEAKVAAE